MDQIKKKQRRVYNKPTIIGCTGIVLMLAALYLVQQNKRPSMAKSSLLIATVKQGDLPIIVTGYGKLVSEKLKVITTKSAATVSEIFLKPGAQVTKNSIIAQLDNPDLLRQLASEQQQLVQLHANLRQLTVDQQREQLTEQAILTEIQSAYQSAQLKRQAQQQLADKGIISQISFKQSQLHEHQLQTRVKILTERLDKLSLVHQEAINIQQQRIKQQQDKINNLERQINDLKVKADFNGVIQRMAIKLGQSLQAGQEIALIGSTERLIAEIVVPQHQARLVQTGQQTSIDTRQHLISGEVLRIDPIVENNMVKLDIKLTEQLPADTRPEQNVDANILISTLKNVRYITKPINAQPQSTQVLYHLNAAHNLASRYSVTYGESAGRYIQIKSAIDPGEHLIISDLSNYQNEQIQLD